MSEQRAASGEPVSMFTPVPPERTGVAHYASLLSPALSQHVDLLVNPRAARRSPLAIYQLGNNPHHEWIYKLAMAEPGVIVLHDLVLHHLIVEMTLARGDVDGYVDALRTNHGEAGAAWARGRAAGMHGEIGNFLFPASIDVANRSRAVIVHNRYAADRLRSFGVTTPIHVVPHLYEPYTGPSRKPVAGERVIGMFGFLTSAKRAEVVLEALRKSRGVKLLVVGEPAPNIDVKAFRAEGITFTGYVDDFDSQFGAVDRLVNLRYPTAGETSGTLVRAFAAGKPVAVSDYAQFAELPDDCVTKIPLGDGEVDALVKFFTSDLPDPAAAQRKWLEENASMDQVVRGYLGALAGGERLAASGITRSLALFPKVELVSMNGRKAMIRNVGDITLRARCYGEPAYRIIVKSGDYSRWLELPRDLAPGETTAIEVPGLAGLITFHHALESVPLLDPEPWGRAAIQ